jgi:DNA-binding NarL/FixJ family response regulator
MIRLEPQPGIPAPAAPQEGYEFAAAEDASADAVEPRRGPPLRVLIVEDQPFVALDSETALKMRGHEVVDIALNAHAAAAAARQYRPDVILMDIRLSGSRTGLEAAIEIYKDLGIRCVFATAHGEDFTRRLAEPARPLGWLTKPYTSEEMLAAVEAAGAQIRATQSQSTAKP